MKEKQSIFNKRWFWIIIIIIGIGIIGNIGKGNKAQTPAPVADQATSISSEEASTETVDPQEELREALKEKAYISFSPSVMKDVTGRWRLGKYAEFISQEDLAVEYYKAYFTSDDEIHYLINFSTMTTARIKKISEDKLEVYITEYVDKEEFDAALLGSGMELGQYFVTISTGEIEKIEG